MTTLDELSQVLVRLQLVDPALLSDCVHRVESSRGGAAELLRMLEGRHLLTSYQVSRLERDETDQLVLGEYKLMYRNASGSFARVFRAESIRDGRMIGIKVLRQRWAKDPKMVALFHREAELGQKLQHEYIVPIYEIAQQGEIHYFTMEFVEGGNFRDFLNIRKKLSPVEATRFTLQMAEGLEYALRMGLTHRDLKLTNVLMSSRGVAKLVDFGLAGDVAPDRASASETPQRALEYAALEKGTNAPSHDPRSDLFFLGGIYYELLTGLPPFARTRSRDERRDFARYTNVRSLKSIDPNIPRAVVDACERMMKVAPEQRYQSPTAVVTDLRQILAELDKNAVASVLAGSENGSRESSRSRYSVMCIEHRLRQQNLLRDYLNKHGYRVLMFNDLQRGMKRLESDPPDCVLLMGESIGDDVAGAFLMSSEL
ncbi:MAG: serine/threonine-protein kinase, partial [Planctomycetaceae bacterium]